MVTSLFGSGIHGLVSQVLAEPRQAVVLHELLQAADVGVTYRPREDIVRIDAGQRRRRQCLDDHGLACHLVECKDIEPRSRSQRGHDVRVNARRPAAVICDQGGQRRIGGCSFHNTFKRVCRVLPAESGRFDVKLLAKPQRSSCGSFHVDLGVGSVLQDEVDRRAFTSPCVAHVVDTKVFDALRRNAEIFLKRPA